MISAALWHCVRFIERQPKYSETYMSDILLKYHFLEFHDVVYSDMFQVRWTNLQPSGVTFPEDSVYHKLLKSVHVWQSYSKKTKIGSFLDTVYILIGAILGGQQVLILSYQK